MHFATLRVLRYSNYISNRKNALENILLNVLQKSFQNILQKRWQKSLQNVLQNPPKKFFDYLFIEL
jgi:hypothetical protein